MKMKDDSPSLSANLSPFPMIGQSRSCLTRGQWRLTGWILIASLGDATSTVWGIHLGLEEQNPVMDSLLSASWLGFTLLKTLIPLMLFLSAIWLSTRVHTSRRFWFLLGVHNPARFAYLMIGLYGLAAIHNTWLIIKFTSL